MKKHHHHRPRPHPRPQQAPLPAGMQSSNVARWARRFRRLAAVVAISNEPDMAKLDRLRDLRHGGIGIPRAALAKLPPAARGRFEEEKPFLILDHPEEAVAKVAHTSGPRAPAHLVEACVHALTFCAPLVLLDRRDAQALHPLVSHVVAIPGDATGQVLTHEFDAILRGASAATQDGYGQIDKSGKAVLDLAQGRARERTLSGLLQRLARARRLWAERDAGKRFRSLVDAAQVDAEARGVPKGEKDPLSMTSPVALGYIDLLPLLLTRLGAGSDLLGAMEKPLAQLSLGVGVAALFE